MAKRECPECYEKIDTRAKKCIHCGYDIGTHDFHEAIGADKVVDAAGKAGEIVGKFVMSWGGIVVMFILIFLLIYFFFINTNWIPI